MEMKTLFITLKTSHPVEEDASKLRGFIGNKFPDYPILHHHISDVGFLYTYPKVQYKIIEGTPIILGIEEGAEVVKEISEKIDELTLGKQTYRTLEKQIFEKIEEFGKVKEYKQYKFITPWLALNEKNYGKYKDLDRKNQILLLHKILIGNVLSIAKAFDYVVLSKIGVRTKIKPINVQSKGISLVGFTGEFQVNFDLPDLIGIGKSVSRGFGTVKRID